MLSTNVLEAADKIKSTKFVRIVTTTDYQGELLGSNCSAWS